MSVMARKSVGFTLIEMIITIVVIGVGLAGVLMTFQVVVRSSADPLVSKQLVSVAEAQMESEMLRSFVDITTHSTCTACPPGYASTVTADSPSAWEGIPSANVKRITIDVTYGTQSFQLISRRTNYAP